MEIQLHVVLLIVCSVLFALCWLWRGFGTALTPMLLFCMILLVGRLIALV